MLIARSWIGEPRNAENAEPTWVGVRAPSVLRFAPSRPLHLAGRPAAPPASAASLPASAASAVLPGTVLPEQQDAVAFPQRRGAGRHDLHAFREPVRDFNLRRTGHADLHRRELRHVAF